MKDDNYYTLGKDGSYKILCCFDQDCQLVVGWGWQGGFKPPHLRLPLCLAHWKKQAFLSPHQVALAGIVTHAFLSLYVYFYTRPIVAFQGQ